MSGVRFLAFYRHCDEHLGCMRDHLLIRRTNITFYKAEQTDDERQEELNKWDEKNQNA